MSHIPYLQNVVSQNLHLHLIWTKVLDVEVQFQLCLPSLLNDRHTRLHVRVQRSTLRVVWKQLKHLIPHPCHLRFHRLHLEHRIVEVAVEEVESGVIDIKELLQQSHRSTHSKASSGLHRQDLSQMHNQSHKV